jgi:hypothetical protein
MLTRKSLATIVCASALVFAAARNARASTVITGSVVGTQYLLTGTPVNVTASAVLKMSFEVATPWLQHGAVRGDSRPICRCNLRDAAE